MGETLPLLNNFDARRRPPGHTPDLGKNLVEPLFCESDLRLHIVLIAATSLQIEVQPVEPPNQIEKLYDLGPRTPNRRWRSEGSGRTLSSLEIPNPSAA